MRINFSLGEIDQSTGIKLPKRQLFSFFVREGLKNTSFYPHFVDRCFIPPPLINVGGFYNNIIIFYYYPEWRGSRIPGIGDIKRTQASDADSATCIPGWGNSPRK